MFQGYDISKSGEPRTKYSFNTYLFIFLLYMTPAILIFFGLNMFESKKIETGDSVKILSTAKLPPKPVKESEIKKEEAMPEKKNIKIEKNDEQGYFIGVVGYTDEKADVLYSAAGIYDKPEILK